MKPLPDNTEAEIAKNTTDKVYRRGVDYYEQGSVLSVVRRGDLIQAEVEGSEDEPYLISVTVGPEGVRRPTAPAPTARSGAAGASTSSPRCCSASTTPARWRSGPPSRRCWTS